MNENSDPQHLREAGETIEELRSARQGELPQRERFVQHVIDRMGRPRFIVVVIAFMVLWIVLNSVLRAHHLAFDDEKFTLLNTISQLTSLVVVLAILSAQNTQRTLEEERARLALQLALITDKKLTEALKQIVPDDAQHELHEPTDLHQAAEVLRKAEAQQAERDPEGPDGAGV